MKSLLHKHEDLKLISRAWGGRRNRILGAHWPVRLIQSMSALSLGGERRRKIFESVLWSLHACAYMRIYTITHTHTHTKTERQLRLQSEFVIPSKIIPCFQVPLSPPNASVETFFSKFANTVRCSLPFQMGYPSAKSLTWFKLTFGCAEVHLGNSHL